MGNYIYINITNPQLCCNWWKYISYAHLLNKLLWHSFKYKITSVITSPYHNNDTYEQYFLSTDKILWIGICCYNPIIIKGMLELWVIPTVYKIPEKQPREMILFAILCMKI